MPPRISARRWRCRHHSSAAISSNTPPTDTPNDFSGFFTDFDIGLLHNLRGSSGYQSDERGIVGNRLCDEPVSCRRRVIPVVRDVQTVFLLSSGRHVPQRVDEEETTLRRERLEPPLVVR